MQGAASGDDADDDGIAGITIAEGHKAGVQMTSGYSFANITIPQGSVIKRAYLKVKATTAIGTITNVHRKLYAEDADNHWHPASLTKMMTAYLVFDEIRGGRLGLKSKISCSAKAHKEPPSKIGLPIGGKMSVDLALKSLIVKSANDVAIMLAEAVAGSEKKFVERMNATAKRLGMMRTHFVNPHGLPADDQVTGPQEVGQDLLACLEDDLDGVACLGARHTQPCPVGKRHVLAPELVGMRELQIDVVDVLDDERELASGEVRIVGEVKPHVGTGRLHRLHPHLLLDGQSMLKNCFRSFPCPRQSLVKPCLLNCGAEIVANGIEEGHIICTKPPCLMASDIHHTHNFVL